MTSGWGRYPVVGGTTVSARTYDDVRAALADGPVTPRGLGRSYGDSALGARMLDLNGLDHFVGFDEATGSLTCEAGVSLSAVLAATVSRGWFLPVTPGTRFVTLGGAIASDVHGKNHHLDGTFCDHVSSFRLMLASGEVLDVSRMSHPDLFRATCGGMGLTGVILEATVALKRVGSRSIEERIVRTGHLDGLLDALAETGSATYSVAWMDVVATGRRLGRSLLMLGEHAAEGELAGAVGRARSVPFDAPACLLNRFTVGAFNALYYARVRRPVVDHRVDYEPFFYPLDRIQEWNRLYGRKGFVQYQFVLPASAGRAPLVEAVTQIAGSGLASPLAVLKVFGPHNENLLSFPTAGYTLAVDLKASADALRLCDRLDRLVVEAGGRLYLAKDARMSREMFEATYPRLEEFEKVRRRYGATGTFTSAQAERLGIG